MAEASIQDVPNRQRIAAVFTTRGHFFQRHWSAVVALSVLLLGCSLVMADGGPVNINTAPAEVLAEKLSGVGITKAYRIVEHREAYGPFETIEELAEVKGIGPSILDRNQGNVVLE